MFLEQRFFDDVRPQASGGPVYATSVKTLRGGGEHRNALWADPLRMFNVTLGARDVGAVESILSFHADARGAANGFRFRDWSDPYATDEQIGVGDGVSYWARLVKAYGSTYSRRILKPVAGTVLIRLNGATLAPTLYAVDTVNGLVIFKTAPAPGVVITANFEFDVPVRFTEDSLNMIMLSYHTGVSDTISLREIRLREVIDIAAIDAIRATL